MLWVTLNQAGVGKPWIELVRRIPHMFALLTSHVHCEAQNEQEKQKKWLRFNSQQEGGRWLFMAQRQKGRRTIKTVYKNRKPANYQQNEQFPWSISTLCMKPVILNVHFNFCYH